MLRTYRQPRAWIIAWIGMIVGVLVLSLIPSPPVPFELTIAKLDHGFAYFCLSTMAVQLLGGRFERVAATALFATLGIALEFAQGFLTDYRDMSGYDAVIDCAGAVVGLATACTPLRDVLQKFDARFA